MILGEYLHESAPCDDQNGLMSKMNYDLMVQSLNPDGDPLVFSQFGHGFGGDGGNGND